MKKKPDNCCTPAKAGTAGLTTPADPAFEQAVADLAKAMAHPVRVRILRTLLRRGTCVCGEIVDGLPLAQSTVSEHLRILKAAGLVRGRVDGPRVCYCADPAGLARLKELLKSL